MSNFFPPAGGTPQSFLDITTERIQSVNGFVNMLESIGERQDVFDPVQTTTINYKNSSSFISVLRKRNIIQPPPPPAPGVCPIPQLILDYAYGQYEASYSLINLPFELTAAPLVSVSYVGCKWQSGPGEFDFKSPYFNTAGSVESEGLPGTNLTVKLYASMCLPFPSSIPYGGCVYVGPDILLVCVKLLKPIMTPLIRQPAMSQTRKITSLLDTLTN
jgi:hypothetical protein